MPSQTDIKLALAIEVTVTANELQVRLDDGRTITTPIAWYPRLLQGKAAERKNVVIIDGGRGLHWPELDEDLSVEGMLAGRPSAEGPESLARWRRRRGTL